MIQNKIFKTLIILLFFALHTTIQAQDAALTRLESPSKPLFEGFNPIIVDLHNAGTVDMFFVDIKWSVNDTLQPTYNWTGNSIPGQTDTVFVGNYNFLKTKSYDVKVWVEWGDDGNSTNDTLKNFNLWTGMQGNYTIGGSSTPDFTNFQQAVDALSLRGIIGPTTFLVRDGTYTEQIEIPAICGQSRFMPIEFRSELGIPTNVTLKYGGTNTKNYIVKMDSTEGVFFWDMTLEATNNTYGRIAEISGGGFFNGFNNCTFKGITTTSTSSNLALIYSASTFKNEEISLHGCTLENGSYGVYFEGHSSKSTLLPFDGIAHCTFTNQYAGGLYLHQFESPTVRNNIISSTSTNPNFIGIHLKNVSDSAVVTANNMMGLNEGTGIFMESVTSTSLRPSYIHNNMIPIGGSSMAKGIYIKNSLYQNVFYNSVSITNSHASSVALEIENGGNISVINNALANTGGGVAYKNSFSSANVITSNYNDIYATGTNIGTWNGTNYATLTTWQTGTSQDANSLSINPNFLSTTTDLHLNSNALENKATPLTQVMEDIDFDFRDATMPDIGADEYGGFVGGGEDLSVQILAPVSDCVLGIDTVKIVIDNFGFTPQTGFDVTYVLNNGTPVTETINATVQLGIPFEYSFATLVDLSTVGTYDLKVYHSLVGDVNTANDTMSMIIDHFGPLVYTKTPDTIICSGTSADLMVLGNNLINVSWTTGEVGNTITVSPTTDSLFIFTAENIGGCTKTDSIWVSVSGIAAPVSITATNSGILCAGDSVMLTASYAGGNLFWNTGDTTQNITVRQNGTYIVTHEDPQNCAFLSSDTIEVIVDTSFILSPLTTSICLGDSVELFVHNPASVQWSTGDTAHFIKVAPTDTTNYIATITTLGGCTFVDSVLIAVQPTFNHTLTPDTSICEGTTIALKATGGANYQWSHNVVGSQINVQPLTTTTYTVTITALSGCIKVDAITVTVVAPPMLPTITPNGALPLCEDSTMTLTTNLTTNILWSTGETTPSITVSKGGTYTVTDVQPLGSVCNNVSNSVVVTDVSKEGIKVVGYQTLCLGSSTQLTVTGLQTGTATWSNGATTDTITVMPSTTTNYSVMATTTTGCPTIDTVTITVNPAVPPTAVTNMIPANNTLNLPKPVAFSWSPGTNTVDYDLFVWQKNTARPANPTEANLTTISTSLYSGLANGSSYWWQIRSQNSCFETYSDTLEFSVVPLPDLTIDTIIAPATALSNTQITISWTTKNIGLGSTGSQTWNDYIWLSTDDDLREADDILLGQVLNQSYLHSGDSYSQTQTVTLPTGLTGQYLLFVTTDNNDAYCVTSGCPPNGTRGVHRQSITESNEQNNYLIDTLLITPSPAADLQITSINLSNTTFSYDTVDITYTIKNFGAVATTTTSWYDQIYISRDSFFNGDGTDTLLKPILPRIYVIYTGSYVSTASSGGGSGGSAGFSYDASLVNSGLYLSNYGGLEKDSCLTRTAKVRIPLEYSGKYFIHVVADALDDIEENTKENNNIGTSNGVNVTLRPPPDLQVTQITAPVTGASGQPITIDWTVENKGNNTPIANFWTDSVFISKDAMFDPSTAIFLKANKIYNLGFAANSTYNSSTGTTTKLPNGISGNYYVYVKTDAKDDVFEFNKENNNLTRSTNTINISLSPSPDFVVSKFELTPCDTISADSTITLTWTVKNQGTGVNTTNWKDKLYFAKATAPNNLQLWETFSSPDIVTVFPGIGISVTPTPLNVGDSLVRSLNIPVPNISGKYFVFLKTDADDAIYEHNNENNNQVRLQSLGCDTTVFVPQTITNNPIPTDLTVSDLEIIGHTTPATGNAGQPISLSWTVENNGSDPTSVLTWADGVYLSSDPVLDAFDTYLNGFPSNGAVNKNATYSSNNKQVTLPNGISGTYYVIIKTDISSAVSNDTVKANNIISALINITLPPSPDLQITNINAPTTGYAGQAISIPYTVQNSGVGSVNGTTWYDQIYLSNSPTLSSRSPTSIGYKQRSSNLALGGNYTDTIIANLPIYASGNYYLILKTDGTDAIYEHNAENNNESNQVILVSPASSVNADLVVSSVTLPPSITLGKLEQASITVKNQGTTPVTSNLRSALHLSTDTQYDGAIDPLFQLKDDANITLGAGDSTTYQFSHRLEAVDTGSYYGIGRTNTTASFPENNLNNNEKVSSSPILVDAMPLTLNIPDTNTLAYDAPLYYKVNVGANKDLLITLSSDFASVGINEIYVAYNRVPNSNSYDFKHSIEKSVNNSVLVPETKAGTYFICAKTQVGTSTQGTIILAKALPFSILTINPNTVGQGKVTTSVTGAGFRNGIQVVLKDNGNTVATATVKNRKNSMEMDLGWDLTNVAEGTYDVVATNPDNSTVTVVGGLTVEKATIMNLDIVELFPDVIRFGKKAFLTYQVENSSNIDIDFIKGQLVMPLEVQVDTFSIIGANFITPHGMANNIIPTEISDTLDNNRVIGFVARDFKPGDNFIISIDLQNFPFSALQIQLNALPYDRASFVQEQVAWGEMMRNTYAQSYLDDPSLFRYLDDPSIILRADEFRDTLLNQLFSMGLLLPSDTVGIDLVCSNCGGYNFSPGTSPGLGLYQNATFAPNQNMLWEINHPDHQVGKAGKNPGWDLVYCTGTLNITATSANRFTIDLASLSSYNNQPDFLTSWSPGYDHAWAIAIADGGITGFDTAKFTINETLFTAFNNTYGGTFSLALGSNSDTLYLVFNAATPQAGQQGFPGGAGQPGQNGGIGGPGGDGDCLANIQPGAGGVGGTGGIGLPGVYNANGLPILPGKGGTGGQGGKGCNSQQGGDGGQGGKGGYGGPGQKGGSGGQGGKGGDGGSSGKGGNGGKGGKGGSGSNNNNNSNNSNNNNNNGGGKGGNGGKEGNGTTPGTSGTPGSSGTPWGPNNPFPDNYPPFDPTGSGPDDPNDDPGASCTPTTTTKTSCPKPGNPIGCLGAAAGCALGYLKIGGNPFRDFAKKFAFWYFAAKCSVGAYNCFTGGNTFTRAFSCATGHIDALTAGNTSSGVGAVLGGSSAAARVNGCNNVFCKQVPVVSSCDPNEIVGPLGYGAERWVSVNDRLDYTIHFENDSAFASAAAQRVTIRQNIHPNFDISTFELNKIGFANLEFTVPSGRSNYSTTLNTTADLGVDVQVTAGLDVVNNQLFWILQAIDKNTGAAPASPFAGFLAINDTLGNGQGFVSYSMKPKSTASTGDSITASAAIIFDINAPIGTNTVVNLIDAKPPVSTVTALPSITYADSVLVEWTGTDDTTGVQFYNLFYKKDNGNLLAYGGEIDSTSIMFRGDLGSRYDFYTIATDNVGNREATKTIFETFTVLTPEDSIVIISPTTNNTYCSNDTITIEWEQNSISKVDLVISTDNGVSYTTIVTNIDTSQNPYAYPIPNNSASSQVIIQIRENGGTYAKLSDTFVINSIDTINLTATTCNPNNVGITSVLLQNQNGCDSLVITNTTLLQSDTTNLMAVTCDPNQAGTTSVLLQNQNGCDSLVITNTTLLQSDTTNLMAVTCDPNQAGTTSVLLQNQNGCDSLVITNTTLLQSDTTNLMAVTCDPNQAGTTSVLLQNQNGCDSLVITNTTLLQSDTTNLTATTCDPNQTGTTSVLLQNLNGCDSLVITNTTLLQSDTTNLTAVTCDPNQAGITSVLLQNQNGCDSLIITNTMLLQSDTTNLTATTCDANQAGITSVLLQNQNGCDSLIITNTTLLQSDTTNLTATTCDPNQAGTTSVLLQNQNGCDSLIITNTMLLQSDTTNLTATTCDPNQAGTTSVLLQNQNGCDSLVITTTTLLPSPISVITTLTPINCHGDSTGIVVASASSAMPPYQYSWSTGTMSDTANQLFAGIHYVTITDELGCQTIDSVTLMQPQPITTTFTITDSDCNAANGSATVIPSGGVGGYTYLWSNGSDSASAINLSANTYSVTITDANNCSQVEFVTINYTNIPVVDAIITDASCKGGDDGSIDLVIISGTAPFTYQWSTTDTTQDIANLQAGSYTVNVIDANNCITPMTFIVNEPPIAFVTDTTEIYTVCGGSTGVASVHVISGQAPFTYLWNTTDTTASISGLSAGNYTVTATDGFGCEAIYTFDIKAFGAPIADFSVNVTDSLVEFTNNSIDADTVCWFFGNGDTSTANMPTFIYDSSGIYTVTLVVKNACGTDTMRLDVDIMLVNTQRIDFLKQVQVLPNPNVGQFTLVADGLPFGDWEIRLTTVTGQTIYTEQTNIQTQHFEQRIDMGTSAAGVYFVSLIGENGMILTKRVVLVR